MYLDYTDAAGLTTSFERKALICLQGYLNFERTKLQ